MVIDGAITLTGSYNWTRGAAVNSENLNLISSPAVAADIARWTVIAPHREGGQAQFIPPPARTAGSSPLCTKRYTVILDTRMTWATSATVRNLTSESRAASPPVRALPCMSDISEAML